MRRNNPDYIKELSIELRKNQTKTELLLWEKIRRKQLGGLRFLRQYIIGRYIVDFYCSEKKIAIEIDGEIHENEDQMEKDLIRDETLKMNGIRVIRITNKDIKDDLDLVLENLLSTINNII